MAQILLRIKATLVMLVEFFGRLKLSELKNFFPETTFAVSHALFLADLKK